MKNLIESESIHKYFMIITHTIQTPFFLKYGLHDEV